MDRSQDTKTGPLTPFHFPALSFYFTARVQCVHTEGMQARSLDGFLCFGFFSMMKKAWASWI